MPSDVRLRMSDTRTSNRKKISLWLAGYKEKVRNAFGYTAAQEGELEDEIVRSISGKLQSGTALDAYNRLQLRVTSPSFLRL